MRGAGNDLLDQRENIMSQREETSSTDAYQPQQPVLQWLEKRLPIGKLIYDEFVAYPTPRNLNYWWTFGAILTFMLGVQFVTGIALAMHYTPRADLAFEIGRAHV